MATNSVALEDGQVGLVEMGIAAVPVEVELEEPDETIEELITDAVAADEADEDADEVADADEVVEAVLLTPAPRLNNLAPRRLALLLALPIAFFM